MGQRWEYVQRIESVFYLELMRRGKLWTIFPLPPPVYSGPMLGLLTVTLGFGENESVTATPLATIFGLAHSKSLGPRIESSSSGAVAVGTVVDVTATSSMKS